MMKRLCASLLGTLLAWPVCALAITKPAPGAAPEVVHRSSGTLMPIGFVVAIAVAIVSALWWYQANYGKKTPPTKS